MVIQHLNEGFRDTSKTSGGLSVVKKAGGSIIEHPALFSRDAKNVFITWSNSVRAYSVETGELVTIYEGLTKDAIGIALHPIDSDKLIAVSSVGELIEWDSSSRGSFARRILLGENNKQLMVHLFSLIPLHNEESPLVVCITGVVGQDCAFVRTFCSASGKEIDIFPKIRADNNNHSLAVRYADGEILMAVFCNKPKTTLTFCVMFDDAEKKVTQVFSQNRITCVACHPTELCVITGDMSGCVRVWKNLLRKPIWASYHWHTLPVQTIVFSHSGSYFYSGGGECVLVRWLLESPKQNRFLPRLSAEITHLAVSPENLFVAVSTRDNGIQLVNSSLNHLGTIQHFSWTSLLMDANYFVPVEMTSDPRTKSLVTNGHVGHMQFYSVDRGNLLYLLDVVGHNYLTQERSKTIKNTEVVKFAFNVDGSWLASVEFCEEEGKVPMELRLKFWEYNKIKQKYILNTSIENPHKGKVKAIQFRPSANNDNLMCVTTGEDLKFRTWSVNESSNIYRKGHIWNSENVGFYRGLPVGDISFSTDGSLMAITFGPTLTIWVPGTNQLKCSLTQPDTKEKLSYVEFGHTNCAHLVVTGSRDGIAVWNLLSLSLSWVVHFNLSVLVADPFSEVMAAFSNKNDLVIFSPSSSEPIFKQNNLISCEERIVNAVFVPHSSPKNSSVSWQSASELYFLNSKQMLFCLEHPIVQTDEEVEERTLDNIPAESYRPKTAYAAMLAHHSQSDVVDPKKEAHKHLGIPGFKTLQELLNAPAYAMPPLSLISYPLLISFISKTNTRMVSRIQPEDTANEERDEDSDENERPISNFEDRKKIMTRKQQSETASELSDMEQLLTKVQKKSLDWVSDLLT